MSGRNKAQHFYRVLAALFLVLGAAIVMMPRSGAQAGTVVINELMAENLTSIVDGDLDHADWIELYNPTAAAIDLGGWQISDTSAIWPIPAGTMIGADGYLLIWASDKGDPADIEYPGADGELHTNFKLSSTLGDSVTLLDAVSSLVDTVSFGPMSPDESLGTDGFGGYAVFPLADVTPGAQNTTVAPTPTATPPPPVGPPGVIFNEVMPANDVTIADGAGDFEDWFELYNPTCTTVDLLGWKLADSEEGWLFETSTVLAPGETLLIWASSKGDPDNIDYPGPAGELHTSFQLMSAGETISLIDPDGFLIHKITPPALNPDQAWALVPGDVYTAVLAPDVTAGLLNPGQVAPDCTPTPTPTPSPIPTPTVTPTPGGPMPTATATPSPTSTPTPTPTPSPTSTPTPTATPDVCSVRVVINEVMPRNGGVRVDGDGDFSDWIELYNPTASTVDLSLWTISDSSNSWQFPVGASIAANEYLLVWASDKGDPDDPDYPGAAGQFHTNFRLSGGGESVTLTDTSGCENDHLSYQPVEQNESVGITSDGTIGVFRPGQTTAGRPNGDTDPPPYAVCRAPLATIRLNRIVAANNKLLLDGAGDDSDFVELFNTGFDPVDLTAWQISDENETWIIPAGTVIAGYETLIIWTSGKGFVFDEDYPGPVGELHTTFKLTSDGELVTIAEPSGCIADDVLYPPLGRDEAYGFDAQGQRAILLPGSGADVDDSTDPTDSCVAAGSVVIAALQANNDFTRSDEDGEFGDWIEFANTTDESIDLSGWIVSDGGAQWVVPDGVVIGPDDVVVIWADDKDRGSAGRELHTNFKLANEGETVTLAASSDCLVERVTYPEIDADVVWLRGADGQFSASGGATNDDDGDDSQADDSGPSGDIQITGTCMAINELMAKNDSTLEDEDGEFGDWIELVNIGGESIDLSGWQISDESDSWSIPDGVVIEAGEFLMIWADEGDTGESGQELHANFKLGGSGEPIKLVTADGELAAQLSTYPELEDDESFGVDEAGEYVVFAAGDATPGEGPILTGGCDFVIGTSDATADAGETEAPDEDSTTDAATDSSDDGVDDALARTGTDPSMRSLVGQLLLLGGAVLVVMARISERRSVEAALLRAPTTIA